MKPIFLWFPNIHLAYSCARYISMTNDTYVDSNLKPWSVLENWDVESCGTLMQVLPNKVSRYEDGSFESLQTYNPTKLESFKDFLAWTKTIQSKQEGKKDS